MPLWLQIWFMAIGVVVSIAAAILALVLLVACLLGMLARPGVKRRPAPAPPAAPRRRQVQRAAVDPLERMYRARAAEPRGW